MEKLLPIDLDRAQFRRRLRGYDRKEVEAMLRSASEALTELRRENELLRDRIAMQAEEVGRTREQERALHEALITAQRAADETRNQAQREAQSMREEARLASLADRVTAQGELSELRAELERLRHERDRFREDFRASLERYLRDLGPSSA